MTWNPYRVAPSGRGFRLTYSRWVPVPDGGGCIDWDEETELVDGPAFSTKPEAEAEAERRNAEWREADRRRRAALAAPP